MRKILEELYHGNLSVDERTIRAGSKYARALAEVAKIEEAIYERLPEKDHVLLRDYALASAQLANVSMAPQCGQTYLMLRFLPVLRPPLMVVVVSPPSSSSALVLIWSTALRLAVISSMPGCWASHSAVSSVSVVIVQP